MLDKFKKIQDKILPSLSAFALVNASAFTGIISAQSNATVEEIVVTATKRAESVQDVSIPVTAVSGETLKRQFAQDLRDPTDQAPNVQFEPVGIFQNSSSFFIHPLHSLLRNSPMKDSRIWTRFSIGDSLETSF